MTAQPKRESLNIRIKSDVREKIDRAAELAGKSRTDFVLDAALRAAEEVLLDQNVFMLSDADYKAFLAKLDEPPNERFLKTMNLKAPWD